MKYGWCRGYIHALDVSRPIQRVFVLLGLLLVLGPTTACPDDTWELVAHCATGQAQHVNDELGCYSLNGAPVKFRKWRADDNATTACAFCDGTESIDGGTQ